MTVHIAVKPCPSARPDPEQWIGWDYRFSAYERVSYRLPQLTPAELELVSQAISKLLGR